jgi:hypothetical protein
MPPNIKKTEDQKVNVKKYVGFCYKQDEISAPYYFFVQKCLREFCEEVWGVSGDG